MADRSALTSGRPPGNVKTVAHVELSVSEPHLVHSQQRSVSSLERWTAAVRDAEEFCLLLDTDAVVVAISPPFEGLLGAGRAVVGRDLFDDVLKLIDFADGGPIADGDASKIPPLMALTSGHLARGLLRVDTAEGQCTFDAVGTPLVEGAATAGSLTFFSRI